MSNLVNQFGYKLFIVLLIHGVFGGCSNSEKIPVTPNKETASKLLSEIKKLERYIVLAVIAATPAKVGGNPFSLEDTQKSVKEIKRELEFLEKGKEESSFITSAQNSLGKYIDSHDPKYWKSSWKLLLHGIEEFSDFSRSSLWNDLVPRKESIQVISQLDKLKSMMKEIRGNKYPIVASQDVSTYFVSKVGKYKIVPDLTQVGWTLSKSGTSRWSNTDQFVYNGYPGSTPGQLGILWHPIQNSSPTDKLKAMLLQYKRIYQKQNPGAQVSIHKAPGSTIPMPSAKKGVCGSYNILINRYGTLKESKMLIAVIEKSRFLYTIVIINPSSSGNLPAQLVKSYDETYELTFKMILKSIQITR